MPASRTLRQLESEMIRGTSIIVAAREQSRNLSTMPRSRNLDPSRKFVSAAAGRQSWVFGMQSFWPVQSDVAVYHRELGELRINAKSNKEKELYCRLLGKHLFGNESCFPTGVKYTQEPLREFWLRRLTPGTVNR